MNTRTAAQRYNNRMDKIFDGAMAHENAINDIENVILQMVDLSDQVTRSDLQGIVGAEARNLYWKINGKDTK